MGRYLILWLLVVFFISAACMDHFLLAICLGSVILFIVMLKGQSIQGGESFKEGNDYTRYGGRKNTYM